MIGYYNYTAVLTYLGLSVTASALLPLFSDGGQLCGLGTERAAPVLLCMAAAFLTPFPLKKAGGGGKLPLLAAGATVPAVLLVGVTR